MDEDTQLDPQLLGSELQASREGRRPKLLQPEVAEALGVSRTTIQNVEAGKFKRISATVRRYAQYLGWPDGAVEHVAAGGRLCDFHASAHIAASAEDPAPPQSLGLSPAVEYELRAGDVLDSQVINLGPDEEDGQIIVVLQGKKGASQEEVARVAARYRRARRHLQGIAADADEVADST
ncbi:helix-turn-helix domain-containing protein [Streptomyces alfalfae]|uniref:Helix-turn-helix domain-containing protein n=1 Tax=Streptomyces alfalfae TaxID=1642299 RepID=A0A7T4PGP1_9ACTN|nr:helix-turn-helix transcriptional regulator [Streptomyces alfalfae]QQC89871.1 helix-turn-helix domain-containing protein [Streptomyces alfalfae]